MKAVARWLKEWWEAGGQGRLGYRAPKLALCTSLQEDRAPKAGKTHSEAILELLSMESRYGVGSAWKQGVWGRSHSALSGRFRNILNVNRLIF